MTEHPTTVDDYIDRFPTRSGGSSSACAERSATRYLTPWSPRVSVPRSSPRWPSLPSCPDPFACISGHPTSARAPSPSYTRPRPTRSPSSGSRRNCGPRPSPPSRRRTSGEPGSTDTREPRWAAHDRLRAVSRRGAPGHAAAGDHASSPPRDLEDALYRTVPRSSTGAARTPPGMRWRCAGTRWGWRRGHA